MANNFTRGQTFVDGVTNQVTAAALHALVESAQPTVAMVTDRTEKTTPATGDTFLIYDAADGSLKKLKYENTSASPTVLPGYRNLLVKNNSGSPTTTIDITADDAVLRDSGNAPKLHSSVSVSANITVSGANGLDTGVESSGTLTWYYIWLISNGTTVASLLSVSATAPTMPGGYTYKLLVGGVVNTTANDFWVFHQRDDIYFNVRQAINIASAFTANSDPTSATNYVTFAMDGTSSKPFVPTNAVEVFGSIGRTDADSARIIISGSTAGIGAQIIDIPNSGTVVDSFTCSGTFRVPLVTAQTVFIRDPGPATASGDIRIAVSGFRLKR